MKILSFFLFIILSINLNGQVINKQESDKIEGIKRKSSFNVEEIKVRWKKAALENCPGVPCTTSAACTAGTPSSSPTLSFTSTSPITLTPITIVTTGATGIGTPTGLPPGISATWAGNVITISGAVPLPSGLPGTCGTFNYTIPLIGCSGVVNATGTIIVTCPA